jgi:hypothetical protein
MLSVVSLLALSACSNDDSDTLTRVPLTIKATIQGAETRVTYSDDGSGSFEKGDVINVFCYNSGVSSDYSSLFGVEYTFDGEKWNTDKPLYLDPNSTGSYTLYAYYGIDDIIVDQSNGLASDRLNDYTTCSARNPEAKFSFKHESLKITLNFTSAVTECILMIDSYPTIKCHLINDDKTAEALLNIAGNRDLKVQVTVGSKIYTGTIGSTTFEANHHYIYDIKISDVLTVDSGTSITGFEDSGTTFEAEQN